MNAPLRPAFKDHFSGHAALYSRFRPTYPAALYEFLVAAAPAHELAWDCATGGGQAAIALANCFSRVIATDASAAQLENAPKTANIEYRVAPAEQSGLPGAGVDLITVAQALHWFSLDAFYAECRRVLKPGGLLAVWGYNLLSISPEIDPLVNHFYVETVGPCWPPERQILERGYHALPFPFTEIPAPSFAMTARWTLAHLTGYIESWSAVQRYRKENQRDPLALLAAPLAAAWGDPQAEREISWPLDVRVGKND